MNQQHYTVFGIAITDKEGKEVEREYQAVASPRANFSQGGFYICLTEDPKIERGYQRTQKALEDLALEAAKYAIGLHQKFASDPMKWGEENFLTMFSSGPLPYEQGVDARGNRYAPFQLDKSWLEHFRNKFDEAYQGLMQSGAAARVEDTLGAVLDEETEVFPDGSEVRREEEQIPIGGGK